MNATIKTQVDLEVAPNVVVTLNTRQVEALAKVDYEKKSAKEEHASLRTKNTDLKVEIIQLHSALNDSVESVKGWEALSEEQEYYLSNFFHDVFIPLANKYQLELVQKAHSMITTYQKLKLPLQYMELFATAIFIRKIQKMIATTLL